MPLSAWLGVKVILVRSDDMCELLSETSFLSSCVSVLRRERWQSLVVMVVCVLLLLWVRGEKFTQIHIRKTGIYWVRRREWWW